MQWDFFTSLQYMCLVAAVDTEGAVVVGWSCMLNMYWNGVLLYCTFTFKYFLKSNVFISQ